MAGAVSRWLGSVEDLPAIAQRLLRVQIEHAPAIEVIQRYDSEETLFYCDPPYPHDSRTDSNAYAHEMTNDEHRKLAEVLHHVRGKVALSSYHCELMDELYSDWTCIEAPVKLCHSTKAPRQEVLWVNYEIEERTACQPEAEPAIWRSNLRSRGGSPDAAHPSACRGLSEALRGGQHLETSSSIPLPGSLRQLQPSVAHATYRRAGRADARYASAAAPHLPAKIAPPPPAYRAPRPDPHR